MDQLKLEEEKKFWQAVNAADSVDKTTKYNCNDRSDWLGWEAVVTPEPGTAGLLLGPNYQLFNC